jgi:hypothetical protein
MHKAVVLFYSYYVPSYFQQKPLMVYGVEMMATIVCYIVGHSNLQSVGQTVYIVITSTTLCALAFINASILFKCNITCLTSLSVDCSLPKWGMC